ncbi:hypothetical protein GUITHDRAFT_149644, partial [Guillardia theta CCMP2712]
MQLLMCRGSSRTLCTIALLILLVDFPDKISAFQTGPVQAPGLRSSRRCSTTMNMKYELRYSMFDGDDGCVKVLAARTREQGQEDEDRGGQSSATAFASPTELKDSLADEVELVQEKDALTKVKDALTSIKIDEDLSQKGAAAVVVVLAVPAPVPSSSLHRLREQAECSCSREEME